jgi:protein arginine N-methyltransferase 1
MGRSRLRPVAARAAGAYGQGWQARNPGAASAGGAGSPPVAFHRLLGTVPASTAHVRDPGTAAMSVIEYHRTILADRVRNRALYRALERSIVPGVTTVADIGAGTGFIGFLARRLGAREVHLYEHGSIIDVAETLARRNRLTRVHFHPEHSRDVRNPPQVDLVVCETLGNFAYEENIIETLADARRFLKPGGVLLPQRIEQWVAPIGSPRWHRELASWRGVGFDLDFAVAERMSRNNLYVRRMLARDVFGGATGARRWDTVTLGVDAGSVRRGRVGIPIARAGTVYGLALWWRCELLPGISLSTAPDSAPTHWEQLYAPLNEPIALRPGDTLEVALGSDTQGHGAFITWEVRVRRGRRRWGRQRLDLQRGDPELAPARIALEGS